MPYGSVFVFATCQIVVAILFSYIELPLFFFAVFTVVSALVFARFFGGLKKEPVDVVYYILGSFGVVLFALSQPFSMELYFTQASVADYQKRVELLENFEQYPAPSLARSEQTSEVTQTLKNQIGDFEEFGTLIVFEDCETSNNDLCETRNRNGELARGVKSFDQFWSYGPLALDETKVAALFHSTSRVKLFSDYNSNYVFEYTVPSTSAFVTAMTYDIRSEHYQKLKALGAEFLLEDRESLSFHQGELSELTNHGEPTFWAVLAGLLWPFLLLVALATKLAREYSRTTNILAKS